MTAPVVVDPAPPDLAAGLDALAAAARSGTGALLLVAADLTVHREALGDLAEDPRPATAVLVSRDGRTVPGLRVRAGSVVAAGTPAHRVADADTAFAGALRLAGEDRVAAAGIAGDLAGLARRDGWAGDPLEYLVLGLVRTGVRVGTVPLDPWPWRRGPAGADALAQADLDGMDERAVHAVRFARATKSDDGFVATFLSRPLSRLLTPWALRLGLTPEPGHGRVGGDRAGRGRTVRRRRPGRARRRRAAAAAVPRRRLRRRRRRPVHPTVQPARGLAGRLDGPAQGVRLLRRPGLGRRCRTHRLGAGRGDDRAADDPAQHRLHLHRGEGPARGRGGARAAGRRGRSRSPGCRRRAGGPRDRAEPAQQRRPAGGDLGEEGAAPRHRGALAGHLGARRRRPPGRGPRHAAGARRRVVALHLRRPHPAGQVVAARAGDRPGARDRAGPGGRRSAAARQRSRRGSPADPVAGSGSSGCAPR